MPATHNRAHLQDSTKLASQKKDSSIKFSLLIALQLKLGASEVGPREKSLGSYTLTTYVSHLSHNSLDQNIKVWGLLVSNRFDLFIVSLLSSYLLIQYTAVLYPISHPLRSVSTSSVGSSLVCYNIVVTDRVLQHIGFVY